MVSSPSGTRFSAGIDRRRSRWHWSRRRIWLLDIRSCRAHSTPEPTTISSTYPLLVLIMEALVLGGQHGLKKTMGNTASPPCVCCETQIGGGGYGFLPHHSLPLAAIKLASLISPSIYSFLGLTHSVPLSLIRDGVGGLGCSMVQNMFELWLMWLKFDCRIWWWWIW